MQNVGKNGPRVVERHIIEKPIEGPTRDEYANLLQRVSELDAHAKECIAAHCGYLQAHAGDISTLSHRASFFDTRIRQLGEDIDDLRVPLEHDIANLFGMIETISKRIVAIDSKPAQVLRETTVEKPGVTVHEHTVERVPHTSPWVWAALAILSGAQAALIWRLL